MSSTFMSPTSAPLQAATDAAETVVEAAPADNTTGQVHRPRRLRRTGTLRRMVQEKKGQTSLW